MQYNMLEFSRTFPGRFGMAFLVPFLFFCTGGISFAQEPFSLNMDNSVVAGDTHFPTMNEYVASDYFREHGKRCGTMQPVAAVDQQVARSVNDCTLVLTRIQDEYWLSGMVITVPVWFHVLYRSDGLGNIADEVIMAQLDVLNEDYRAKSGTLGGQGSDTRIQFSLAGITRTMNDLWFNDGDTAGYTSALAQDPSRYINVYINTASGTLGYATFPQWSAGATTDRIVIQYTVVGGRNNGNYIYDQGRTLVHEMGHFLGLFHTFDYYGTCSNSYSSGDLIVDTPSESIEHYQCVNEYSCGTPDPIHNYMNYTPDSCMLEFSREQVNRLVCSLVNYRPGMNNRQLSGSIVPFIELLLLRTP